MGLFGVIIDGIAVGGAYDAIQLIMTNKIKSLQYKYSRIICDVISVIMGYIGRAVLGVGTVINAFLMGPIVSFFDKHLTSKFYDRNHGK